MTDLPTGTVTFLFTDIEGSTRLLRELGEEGYRRVQDDQMRIMRDAIAEGGGREIRTEGDSFFVAFPSAPDAVRAAATAQRGLHAHPWTHGETLRVRMGMHSGEGKLGGDDYLGMDVNRAARIAASGHGGQVLLSETTRALVAETLPEGVTIKGLGTHRLKDFDFPQTIHQLVIEGLPSDFPPIRTREVPTNLPLQLTTFVGRERELDQLNAVLGTARLVTLEGPGGSGKTRLAVEVAARRVDDHRDGVFFVDLSPLADPQLVPSVMAQVLGLKEQPGQLPLEAVTAHLADRQSLLILDNFEQVVAGAGHVGEILKAAPRTTILVTSRIRLDLAGEQEFPVPPLEVPHVKANVAVVADSEAVSLFRDRARAVVPSFEISEHNAQAVAEICARLDGLPLAIELAAAQLRVLSPSELLTRLEHRLPLRTGAANVPERQRTLRSTIEWSYDLLEPPLQRFFARLAVFAGGSTLPAIEAVCNPDADADVDTFDALTALVDQSLVRRDESPEGSRFTMLETIREYATERLEAEFDLEETERRHAGFFAALAEEWGPRVRSSEGTVATRILAVDYENVRAALAWSLRADRADIGLRIGAPMWPYWVEHGPVADGRRAVEGLLGLPSAAPRDGLRARAMDALGALAYWEADYATSERAYGEALEISRELGDAGGSAEALVNLGYLAGATRDYARTLSRVEEALEIARAAGLRTEAAEAAGLVGLARSYQGDQEGGISATREALEGFKAEGASYRANEMTTRLGNMYLRLGRLDEAEAHLRAALAEYRTLPSAVGMGATTSFLAAVAASRGEHERALRLAGFSQAVAERMGSSPPEGLIGEREAFLQASRAALDLETVARLVAEGKAMDDEEAIAYGLGEEP